MKNDKYEVTVGNIGSVYSGNNKRLAMQHFREYVAQSKSACGRAGGESVVYWEHGEPKTEFTGKLDEGGIEQ